MTRATLEILALSEYNSKPNLKQKHRHSILLFAKLLLYNMPEFASSEIIADSEMLVDVMRSDFSLTDKRLSSLEKILDYQTKTFFSKNTDLEIKMENLTKTVFDKLENYVE